MCKGCQLGDLYGYLEGYVTPFENAAHNIAETRKWLKVKAHEATDIDQKHHLYQAKSRLDAVAKELSSIRDEFLREPHTEGTDLELISPRNSTERSRIRKETT